MKILITGGGGFQGSHLAEHLLNLGHEISILNTYSVRSKNNLSVVVGKIKFFWGDVRDKDIVNEGVAGQDVIFHLAGNINVDQSLRDPLLFFNNNILGTYNVLEAVKENKCRLIFVSTCEVYGDGHDPRISPRLHEAAELRPNSPYAASKVAADRMCYAYFKSYGVDVTIVRPFNIYGERQKGGQFGAFIPILVESALNGKDLVIFGDGNSTRDYLHVSDIIQGYGIVLKNKSLADKVINFASARNVKIRDIAEYIAKKLNVKVVYGPARPAEVSRLPADISFARSLGFMPKVDLWQGIDNYINWVKENQNN